MHPFAERLRVGGYRAARRSTCAALIVLLAALVPTPARADDLAVDRLTDLARKHFAEGVKRYRDGDYMGARALFLQADAAHHAPAIIYNIARAEERLGQPQAAVDSYEAYLAEAGEKGEFTQAAIVAIAQIRSSARQLRIETKPSGARVFIDGSPTREAAPTRVLVPAGKHHVVAEGEDWRAEADIDAGPSTPLSLTLTKPDAPQAAAVPPPLPSGPGVPPGGIEAPAGPPPETSDGFIFGTEFTVVPHRFDGTTEKRFSSFGLAAGLMVEAGYAPSNDFVVLGRLHVAAGSKGAPATTLASIGLALSYRVRRAIWIGAAFQGGRALLPGVIHPVGSEQLRYDSDYVFCPSLEVSIAVLTRPYGQWLVSFFPGYYFASPADNDVVFMPIGFGLRTF